MAEQMELSLAAASQLATAADGARPVSDFRTDMMRMPVESMMIAQQEYVARRKQFREWLLSQLQLGVHFGYVPGTEPKFVDENGKDCSHEKAKGVKVWKKGYGNKPDGWDVVPFSSWTAKPSLYKAGAQFVIDLLNLVPIYTADEIGWKQLGSPNGVFVYSCRLFPKGAAFTDENLKGEGRGVRKVGQKGGDENNAIKMAQKCALVDAVLNGFGLADLFTQDTEDGVGPQPHEAPEVKADAPKTQPRNARLSEAELKSLIDKWKSRREDRGLEVSPEAWADWVFEKGFITNKKDSRAASAWTIAMADKCRNAINVEMPEMG